MLYLLLSDDPTGLAAVSTGNALTASASPTERASTSSVYVDNDRSAYGGKPRSAFEQMLAEALTVALTSWSCGPPARLYRRVADLTRITEEVAAGPGPDGLRVNWAK